MRSSLQLSPPSAVWYLSAEATVPLCTCLLEPRSQPMSPGVRRMLRTVSDLARKLECFDHMHVHGRTLTTDVTSIGLGQSIGRAFGRGAGERLSLPHPFSNSRSFICQASTPYLLQPEAICKSVGRSLPSTTHPSPNHAMPCCVSASLDSRLNATHHALDASNPLQCHHVACTSR